MNGFFATRVYSYERFQPFFNGRKELEKRFKNLIKKNSNSEEFISGRGKNLMPDGEKDGAQIECLLNIKETSVVIQFFFCRSLQKAHWKAKKISHRLIFLLFLF